MFPKNDRRRLRKFIFRWLPTSERLHRENNAILDECPSCKSCIETHAHILRCHTMARATIKDQAYKKLDTFLSNEKHTPPSIRKIIVDRLKAECSTSTPPSEDKISDTIKQACNEQHHIGWSHP